MTFTVPDRELSALESKVRTALKDADDASLTVLGYGEVTLVLSLETSDGPFACKRLPVFPNRARFDAYARSLEEYIERLEKGGVRVAETQLWHETTTSGRIVGYCVQRTLPADRLCSRMLRTEPEAWSKEFFTRFLDHVTGAVTPTLGVDAQASNWTDVDGELVYLDVTTPLMRDERGRERLDTRLFFTSLPWLLRDVVRITQAKAIFDKFYSARGIVLDFLGNLHKERVAHLVPGFLEQANARLETPITEAEVSGYYEQDARMWEQIQRLRKADRAWHRKVLHRPYPFLLPPDVRR